MRTIAGMSALGLVVSLAANAVMAQAKPVPITVYKTPTCGCCGKWVGHLNANGFSAKVQDMPSVDEVKTKAGVPPDLQSCHTAMLEGYVIEGHVPADVIHKLLKERPKIAGLAVPGMPVGSPGMEQGDRKDSYDVVAFDKSGKTYVYVKK